MGKIANAHDMIAANRYVADPPVGPSAIINHPAFDHDIERSVSRNDMAVSGDHRTEKKTEPNAVHRSIYYRYPFLEKIFFPSTPAIKIDAESGGLTPLSAPTANIWDTTQCV